MYCPQKEALLKAAVTPLNKLRGESDELGTSARADKALGTLDDECASFSRQLAGVWMFREAPPCGTQIIDRYNNPPPYPGPPNATHPPEYYTILDANF